MLEINGRAAALGYLLAFAGFEARGCGRAGYAGALGGEEGEGRVEVSKILREKKVGGRDDDGGDEACEGLEEKSKEEGKEVEKRHFRSEGLSC